MYKFISLEMKCTTMQWPKLEQFERMSETNFEYKLIEIVQEV